MADWGKYLKNAVANVEQQLDKVLLDNQNAGQPSQTAPQLTGTRRAGRPDLAERLKQATSGSKAGSPASENSESTDVKAGSAEPGAPAPEVTSREAISKSSTSPTSANDDDEKESPLVTMASFATPPDLGSALLKSRQLALSLKQDEMLDIVDALEVFQRDYDVYISNTSERLSSVHSKLEMISASRASQTSGNEQKIALLLEEGQRLSQQELKLGMIIKRLRADRDNALRRATTADSKDRDMKRLQGELESEQKRSKELEALVEHFRGLAESQPGTRTVAPLGEQERAIQKQKYEAERKHEQEREQWQDLESTLLARIAELEQHSETQLKANKQLKRSLHENQDIIKESKDHEALLQTEVDALLSKLSHSEEAVDKELATLKHRIQDLSTQLNQEKERNEQLEKTNATVPGEASDTSDTNFKRNMNHPTTLIDQVAEQLDPYVAREPVEDEHVLGSPLAADAFLADQSQDNLPDLPNTPDAFADLSNAQVDLGESHPGSPLDDSLSRLGRSRRDSSGFGTDLVQGSQTQLVQKMSFTIRKLENDLFSARKSAELALSQKRDIESEVLHLVNSQEELIALQKRYEELDASRQALEAKVAELEHAATEKNERIDELEADVRDLKDMYREQVEALISNIEELRRRT